MLPECYAEPRFYNVMVGLSKPGLVLTGDWVELVVRPYLWPETRSKMFWGSGRPAA